MEVDGEYWQPRDLDGTILYPIIYNGRSYVPVRALLENKGVKVDYDAVERTIILDYPVDDIVSSDVPEPPTDLDLRKLIKDHIVDIDNMVLIISFFKILNIIIEK